MRDTRLNNIYKIDAANNLPTTRSPPAVLANGALTEVAAKVCPADDLPTDKNCLFPSKPEYFHLHRNCENMRKKPRHPMICSLYERQ